MIRGILHKAPEEVTGVQTIQGQLSSLCVPFSVGGAWGNGSDHNSHLLRLQNTYIVIVSYNFHKNHLGPASLSPSTGRSRYSHRCPADTALSSIRVFLQVDSSKLRASVTFLSVWSIDSGKHPTTVHFLPGRSYPHQLAVPGAPHLVFLPQVIPNCTPKVTCVLSPPISPEM